MQLEDVDTGSFPTENDSDSADEGDDIKKAPQQRDHHVNSKPRQSVAASRKRKRSIRDQVAARLKPQHAETASWDDI